MTVCFEYSRSASSRFPAQQGFRLRELQALANVAGRDDSRGAVAAAAAEGIHPGLNINLNARGVIFLTDTVIEPEQPQADGRRTWAIINKILFNGQGYECITLNTTQNYQGVWVKECAVFPAALPHGPAPRPHTPVMGVQRVMTAEQGSRRGTVYANAPEEPLYGNAPSEPLYGNAPSEPLYANAPALNPAMRPRPRPQAGRHRARFNGG